MAEYLASLSPEDLAGFVGGLVLFVVAIVFYSLLNFLHNLASVVYCRIRQRKPRSTRCYFWDCPTWSNCPYNTTPPYKGQSFKEWLQSWRKKGGDAE